MIPARVAALLLMLPLLVACATARVHIPPPPHVLRVKVSLDSARTLVGAALRSEGLSTDGPNTPDVGEMTSRFVVRRGGMGEAEIQLRMHLSSDAGGGTGEPDVILRVDATARDLKRMLLMSPEDARSPRMTREPHPIQDNDRESLLRIARFIDRLQQLGFTTAPPT